jgi:hypothetical protein
MMSQLQEARIPAHTVVDPSAYANDRIHETYCRLRRQSACKAIMQLLPDSWTLNGGYTAIMRYLRRCV